MKKLLIATTNPGKLAELSLFLHDVPLELVSLKDVGIAQPVAETGSTFEQNAILKARYYNGVSGLPTLADDGGAEIDGLDGEPGVKTRRWVHTDRDSTDEEIIAYTLERLTGVPIQKRGMQLRLVLALVLPDGSVHTTTAKVRGVVALEPSIQRYHGFPFRSLLYMPEIKKFYNHDVMTEKENTKYNHRKRAVERLKPLLRKWLTK